MSDYNRTDFSFRPFGAEGIQKDPLKYTWLWISSRGRFSLKWCGPKRSDIECRYAWRHCGEPEKRQHPSYRYRELDSSQSLNPKQARYSPLVVEVAMHS